MHDSTWLLFWLLSPLPDSFLPHPTAHWSLFSQSLCLVHPYLFHLCCLLPCHTISHVLLITSDHHLPTSLFPLLFLALRLWYFCIWWSDLVYLLALSVLAFTCLACWHFVVVSLALDCYCFGLFSNASIALKGSQVGRFLSCPFVLMKHTCDDFT